MKPGDVVVGMLEGAAETKVRPAVVIASRTYLVERPDVLVGILTTKLPRPATSTDHVLLDWQAAGLRAASCFRAYVLTIHRSELTVIGHLSEQDWRQVQACVRAAFERKEEVMQPEPIQIRSASKDVAWEYATLLGSALEIANGHGSPMSHLAQEAFLVHLRNLSEFFREGIPAFKKAQTPPDRPRDNIYAVDFCHSVGWNPKPFGHDTTLIKAINKTVSHMSYSRDLASKGHAHFEGYLHLHGTVKLMRQTWGDFLRSVKSEFLQPRCSEDIHYWLDQHTKDWSVKFSDLERRFETRVNELVHEAQERERKGIPGFNWTLDQTPDGRV